MRLKHFISKQESVVVSVPEAIREVIYDPLAMPYNLSRVLSVLVGSLHESGHLSDDDILQMVGGAYERDED